MQSIRSTTTFIPCLYTRTHVCAMQSFAIYIKIYIKITKGYINDSITTSNSSVRNMYFNYIQINLLSPTNTHLLISPLITPYSPPLFSPFLSLSFPPSSLLYKAPPKLKIALNIIVLPLVSICSSKFL